jgi:predicted nucleotidyltransferase component of viral defense system
MSLTDRREALNIVASQTGRPANLLEKDVWVVQALDVLYSSKFGPHLVFKGGTALSKVHRVYQIPKHGDARPSANTT